MEVNATELFVLVCVCVHASASEMGYSVYYNELWVAEGDLLAS